LPAAPAPASKEASPPPAASPAKPLSRELQKALEEEKAETAAVQVAEEKAHSISERIGDLDEDIALEQKLLETAHKKADNAHAEASALAEQLRTRSIGGGTPPELRDLAEKAREAEQRAATARVEVRQHTQRLDELQSERAMLLAQQLAANTRARDEERRLAE